LLQLVCDNTHLRAEEAARCIERLGTNVRLVLHWLRWVKKDPVNNKSLDIFIDQQEIKTLSKAELGALIPLDLINVLMGSKAETSLKRQQVVPGHIAAEDY
jgi:hypothetical protein